MVPGVPPHPHRCIAAPRKWPKVSSAMNLTVNGDPLQVPDGLSVATLLLHLKLTDGPVAVERNREVVPRAEHEKTWLCESDVLELVHFVGGG